MMWHGRVRTELRTPSAAPLSLGSGLRRETPALDSFLLQRLRVWSLIQILKFIASIIHDTAKKKKKKQKKALNASVSNERTGSTKERQNLHKNNVNTYGLLTWLQLKSKGQCEKSKLKELNFFCKKPNENMTPLFV